jgi:hypothetical protein
VKSTVAIRQPWLTLVRGLWVILAAYNALPGILGLPAYFQQWLALDPWPNNWGWTQASMSSAVSRAGLSTQTMAWIVLVPALLEILAFLSTGLLIFWRKSDDWQSLLVSFVLVGLCGTFAGDRFQSQLINSLPPFWQDAAQEVGVLIWLAFFLFLAIFPDGRFSPRWMRWVALALLPWWVATEGTRLVLGQTPDWIMWIGFIVLAWIVGGKVIRYRHGSLLERQQMRWFLFALIVFYTYSILSSLFIKLFPLPFQPSPLDLTRYLGNIYLSDLAFILIPLAIAIAIFRYRLWDIDLIIRRTLQYGLLTALLALIYWGGVLGLQQTFRLLTGQETPLAIVISTLAIAALFNPLRRRIQISIDRRFYRSHYNTEQILERFINHSRSQADLKLLTGQLISAVQDTIQPNSIHLWLADEKTARSAITAEKETR